MGPAIDGLNADLLNGRIRHGSNPILNMCAVNAKVQEDRHGNKIMYKTKETGRMDGIQALALAYGARLVAEPEVIEEVNEFFIAL